MSVGDSHTAGPDGWPLCGASGPLRGYTAMSQPCNDCRALESQSRWTVSPHVATPHFGGHRSEQAMLRKRPMRLARGA